LGQPQPYIVIKTEGDTRFKRSTGWGAEQSKTKVARHMLGKEEKKH